MPDSVYATAARLGARLLQIGRDFSYARGAAGWSYQGLRLRLAALPLPALAGETQLANAATALAALEALPLERPLSLTEVAQALRAVRLPGRFQIVPGPVEWILDVAHNEPAAVVLARNLRTLPSAARTYAVCGIMRDKDAAAIGRALAGCVDEWIACTLPPPRGLTAQELRARLAPHVVQATPADSVEEGCALARTRARRGDRVVVFGSFATVGPALQWLELY
jgi:dihydrofolate synthase/folylpolyglutamate synthase